jgi:hypothetical protein
MKNSDIGLTLTFFSPRGNNHSIGPLPQFRFEGPVICDEPEGNVLATHHDHYWHTNNQRFSRLWVKIRTPASMDIQAERAKWNE